MFNLTPFQEAGLRVFFFFAILLIIMFWEWLAPRRHLNFSRLRRWSNNLVLVAVNSFLVRLIFPIVAVGAAVLAEKGHWGLFNNIPLNIWLKIIISVVILDFVIYLQHVMFHALPIFWRIHKMHHTDLDFDTTTGLRFHPIEILLSMMIKITIVISLGAPPISVLIFEILLNATSMFNHGNIYLPLKIDKYLRLFVVTPDMHRVHHSIIRQETDSNYGFNLPWWDRLCGTYKSQPQKGHDGMTIGLKQFRDPRYLKINWLLAIPFVKWRT
jgi:sterol desaturase/sphingolipid hydroxylase (fatty acid hydroxylase superfamily)